MEPWTKMPRGEGGAFALLPLYARALASGLLRAADDDGCIWIGNLPTWKGVAMVCRAAPSERRMLREHLPMLEACGVLSRAGDRLRLHQFLGWFTSAGRYWSKVDYAATYARDGALCRYCGDGDDLTIDHVIPRCQGGGDDANLAVACRSCNSRKGGRTPEQAGMVLLAVSGGARADV